MTSPAGRRHNLDLRRGGDLLEKIMRSVEEDIHARGWGANPYLMWVRVVGHRRVEVFEVVDGVDAATLVDALDGFTTRLTDLGPDTLAAILITEAIALPPDDSRIDDHDDGGEEGVEVRLVFGIAIATRREVYLVRTRGDDAPGRWRPPVRDPHLMALRRLVGRAAALRDPDQIWVPEEWTT